MVRSLPYAGYDYSPIRLWPKPGPSRRRHSYSVADDVKLGQEAAAENEAGMAGVMARAGYNPREMANMFKTIEEISQSQPEVPTAPV